MKTGSSNFNHLFFFKTDPRNNTRIESIKIFDRWGNVVFQKENATINDANEAWDSTFNGHAVEQSLYYFIASFNVNGKDKLVQDQLLIVK